MIQRALKGIAIACALVGGVAATWGSGYVGLRALVAGGAWLSPVRCRHPVKLTTDRIMQIRAGAQIYLIDNQPCPTLDELVERKYVPRGVTLDPWGTRFSIDCRLDDDSVNIRSPGPDRAFGTPDDIKSTDL